MADICVADTKATCQGILLCKIRDKEYSSSPLRVPIIPRRDRHYSNTMDSDHENEILKLKLLFALSEKLISRCECSHFITTGLCEEDNYFESKHNVSNDITDTIYKSLLKIFPNGYDFEKLIRDICIGCKLTETRSYINDLIELMSNDNVYVASLLFKYISDCDTDKQTALIAQKERVSIRDKLWLSEQIDTDNDYNNKIINILSHIHNDIAIIKESILSQQSNIE